LNRLEEIFSKEDVRLANDEQAIIHTILTEPLPSSLEQAFIDLVYALETSHDLGLLAEGLVRKIFTKLWLLKKKLNETDRDALVAVQRDLNALLI